MFAAIEESADVADGFAETADDEWQSGQRASEGCLIAVQEGAEAKEDEEDAGRGDGGFVMVEDIGGGVGTVGVVGHGCQGELVSEVS